MNTTTQTQINPELEMYLKLRNSILFFMQHVFALVPQPVKPEYQARYTLGLFLKGKDWDEFCESVRPEWFQEYRNGLHITWQQSLVLHGIDKALRGDCSARMSIVSGHGIGKSTMLSWLILWFLFGRDHSQVACTSPGASQMFDVLWKELAFWINKMPPSMSVLYEWQSTHIRMRESPETWFARAKTASKENTEALAGVHADFVLMAVDEASGVEEPIFETMEGALTSGNVIVFLISNGTRSIGYFYDTHHKDKARWQNYSFSSLDSPRVDYKYVKGIIEKYGDDSVQYAIRVKGEFPDEGVMDDSGYVQLFNENDLHFIPFNSEWKPVGRAIGALDPSGEGQDKSEWAVRDRHIASIVAEEDTSSSSGMAQKSVTLCDKYDVDPSDFVIDAFGKGHDVSMEIALVTSQQKRPWRVYPVNTGEPCEDEHERLMYINKRAEGFYKMMKWCRAGGELMMTPRLKEQLMSIRFKRTANGRIQIMDKPSMKKLGFDSPDKADAISMTFLRPDGVPRSVFGDVIERQRRKDFDEHSPLGD